MLSYYDKYNPKPMRKIFKKCAAWTVGILAVVIVAFFARHLPASVYGGQGVSAGLNGIVGTSGIAASTSITALILKLIAFLLNLVLIIAVLAVIVQ